MEALDALVYRNMARSLIKRDNENIMSPFTIKLFLKKFNEVLEYFFYSVKIEPGHPVENGYYFHLLENGKPVSNNWCFEVLADKNGVYHIEIVTLP